MLITSRPVSSSTAYVLYLSLFRSTVKLCSYLVEKSELTKSINASCAVLLFLGAFKCNNEAEKMLTSLLFILRRRNASQHLGRA